MNMKKEDLDEKDVILRFGPCSHIITYTYVAMHELTMN